MTEDSVLSSEYVYKGKAFNARKDLVRLTNGREAQRDIVEHDACVAIVAVDDEENVLLVNQYRYAVSKYLLEIPAGGIDGNETPEESVKREMQEETGYLPQKVTHLGGFSGNEPYYHFV